MELLLASIITFVSTNIDDIFILTLFFGNKKFTGKDITIGQFVGISTLILISLVASLIGLLISKSYVGLLGLLPIYLGLKGIWELIAKHAENEIEPEVTELRANSNNIFAVAGVTIANGGDNIGIYVPMFNTLVWSSKLVMITIFLIMTGVWCLAANYLTKHPYVARAINKYGHLITPFVLILLGVYILYENETIQLMINK